MNCRAVLPVYALLLSVLAMRSYCQLSYILEKDPKLYAFTSTMSQYFNAPTDLVFVLDESGSVGVENFPTETNFTELITRMFTISPDLTRVAVITFSTDNFIHFNYLSGNGHMCNFMQALKLIKYRGGWTHTKEAIEGAAALMDRGRSGSHKVMVVLSDGLSNHGHDPIPPARSLKARGYIIFSVGVAGANEAELLSVASSTNHLYMIKDFNIIKEVNENLRGDIVNNLFVPVSEKNLCGSCDMNAGCYCGSDGLYRCACHRGYNGTGIAGKCAKCPVGTYSSKAGLEECETCPANSLTNSIGSDSLSHCVCKPGYRGNPATLTTCRPIDCPGLSSPFGGKLHPPTCNNTVGATCSFYCVDNYCPYDGSIPECYKLSKIPLPHRTCQTTGIWNGKEFSCEKVKCPPLENPPHGRYRCDISDFYFKSNCKLQCDAGYKLEKGSGANRRCQKNGTWSGTAGQCEATVCKNLKTNKKLKVKPEECGIANMPYKTVCQYYCIKGFEFERGAESGDVGGLSIGQRICNDKGQWHGQLEKYTCKDTIPPTIHCPPSITVTAPPASKTSDKINWELPTATDNDYVNPHKIRLVYPINEKGKQAVKPPARLPIGVNKLVYGVTDTNKLNATCTMIITVLDSQRPTVKFCPKDIEKFDFKDKVAVKWKEPTFFDNSGNFIVVHQSHKSGDLFTASESHEVVYIVADGNNNTAVCKFNVRVKPYKCPYRRPPLNAALACVLNQNGQLCSVTCNEGYGFADKNAETIFDCHLKHGVGTWITAGSKKKSHSWPDCSEKTKASSSVGLHLQYESSDCQDPVKQREIANRFIKEMRAHKHGKKLCAKFENCSFKHVNITCRTSASTRGRRDTSTDLTTTVTLQYEFDEEDIEEETTDDDSNVDDSYNASDFLNEVLHKISSDNSTDAVGFTVSTKITLSCNPGQLLSNDICVNCPLGSYHKKDQESCELCPLNTYQYQESSTTCLPCLNNTYTLSEGAIHSSDCLSRCAPGTVSDTGLEQCLACSLGTYQDQPQQTSCKSCPEGKTTWAEGAISLVNCTAPCSPGSYSSTGLNPCLLCPLGTYQTQEGQTECIACPGNTTTITEGVTSESACQVIDVCNPNRCAHNGTCMTDETSEGGYNCICSNGFVGSNCEIDIDDCESGLCFNNGTCIDGIDDFSCVCISGFTGEQCEINIDDCFEGACLNGGTCHDEIDSYHCECPPGLGGNKCEFNYDDCAVEPCQNGGTCFDLQQGFRCCCLSGFSGSLCEIDIDECQPNPCLNKAMCQEGINNFTCKCQPGFTGLICEINIDDCESSPCVNHGTCIDLVERYQCMCLPGFQGNNCEIKLSSGFDLSYPSAQADNYIKLQLKEDLPEVTVAFYMQASSKTTRGTPVSFSHYSKDTWDANSNALTWYDYNKFIIYLHGKELRTQLSGNRDNKWHHYAITWSSSNGAWAIYSDGVLHKAGDDVGTNYTLWKGTFVLGQDQDSLGGGFSSTESFQGKLSQFNVWNFVMVPNEIQKLVQSCGYIGNVIAWPHTKGHLSGDIAVIQVSDLCQSKGMCGLVKAECHCHEKNIFDATRCEKYVDTCSSTSCRHGQLCVAHGSSKFCNCSSGLKGKFCQFDVNECAEKTGLCEFKCVNTIGSYHCQCMHGFTLASDRHRCEPITHCRDAEGHVYAENEQWENACKQCSCSKGKIQCRHVQCPAPPNCSKDQQLVNVPGNCCPVCVSMPDGICSLHPNNEFHSFDGNVVKFTSTCRYVFAQDCVRADFSIQVENSQQTKKRKQVQVIARCTNVTVSPQGLVFVDGKKVRLPFTKSDVVNIQPSLPHNVSTDNGFKILRFTALFSKKTKPDGILITLEENVIVLWSPEGLVTVGIPKTMQLKTCGLCGNFNGRLEDDMATRNYLPAKTMTDFILNWRADANKHCPTPDYGVVGRPPIATQTGTCVASKPIFNHALQVCQKLRMKPFTVCYSAVNPREYYDLCMQDACYCAVNASCYCDSISAYVSECHKKGINITAWDTTDNCSSRCQNGMVFNLCGPPCTQTCSGKEANNPLCNSKTCRTGCHCPSSMVLQEGKCIVPSDCPNLS